MRRALILALALSCSTEALRVTATAYSDRGITASGSRTRPGTAAVSRDLLRRYPLGSYIRLTAVSGPHCKGFSTAVMKVTDKTNARFAKRVDVWLPSRSQAIRWGKCRATLHRVR